MPPAKLVIIRRMTFLAIDVGNTRLKWALYEAPRPGAALLAPRIAATGRLRPTSTRGRHRWVKAVLVLS